MKSLLKELVQAAVQLAGYTLGAILLFIVGVVQLVLSFYFNYHWWLADILSRPSDGPGPLLFWGLWIVVSVAVFTIVMQAQMMLLRQVWPDAPDWDDILE